MTYRKLPGRRRGFLFGSSVWLGPDHLLLVKSSRFREEYRRFYFRDIEAIVSAGAPRYHLSTRAALIGVLWAGALAGAIASGREPLEWIAGFVGLLLAGVWMYISGARSCRCRIYTAVSSEELPSLYRDWTARRFVEVVEPFVTEAQGSIEGGAVQRVGEREVGPLPEGRVGIATAAPRAPESRAARTPVSILFVASLCLGGATILATLGVRANVARWVLFGVVLLQLGTAVAVMVQNSRGKLHSSVRNLAIAAAVAIGVWYYAVQMGAGMAEAYRNSGDKKRTQAVQVDPLAMLEYPAARGAAGGIGLLAGLAGLVLLARGERPPDEQVSFNV
jgi:hypothetical protein